MKTGLLTIALGLMLSAIFSCSRSLDPTVAPTNSFDRASYVYQPDSTDFYSAKAILEKDMRTGNNLSSQEIALFDKTEPITYLLNNRQTSNRNRVRSIFANHRIKDVLIGRENGQKVVAIEYEELLRSAPLSSN